MMQSPLVFGLLCLFAFYIGGLAGAFICAVWHVRDGNFYGIDYRLLPDDDPWLRHTGRQICLAYLLCGLIALCGLVLAHG